jgi:hypothetical protein
LGRNLDIKLKELPKHYDFFLPLAGSEVYNSSNDNKADREAAYKMGVLYDILIEANPDVYGSEKSAHELNIFLSRLLFCFFAEDTEHLCRGQRLHQLIGAAHAARRQRHAQISGRTLRDDLTPRTPVNTLPIWPISFPYVNGGLFKDRIKSPKFTSKARTTLIELGELQWQDINPDIFGSMIQAVVRNLDDDNTKHYTSVPNILKLIKPLFLDELYQEYEEADHRQTAEETHKPHYQRSSSLTLPVAAETSSSLLTKR